MPWYSVPCTYTIVFAKHVCVLRSVISKLYTLNYHLKINFIFLYLWFFFWNRGYLSGVSIFFPSVNRSTKFPPVAWKCLHILVWRTSITCRVCSGGPWVNVGTLPPSQNLCGKCDEAFQRVQKSCNLVCWLIPSLGSLLSENETSLSRKRSLYVNAVCKYTSQSMRYLGWEKVSLHPLDIPFPHPWGRSGIGENHKSLFKERGVIKGAPLSFNEMQSVFKKSYTLWTPPSFINAGCLFIHLISNLSAVV